MAHCAYCAILNRLPTRIDAINRAKMKKENVYFGKQRLKLWWHLFFDCIYSRHIWYIDKRKINLNLHASLDDLRNNIQYIQLRFNSKTKSKERIKEFNKACIMLTTVLYHIWKEKNARFHKNNEADSIQSWKILETERRILYCKTEKNHKSF